MFQNKCPNCGEETLEVVSGMFYAKGIRLAKDGFSFSDARNVNTEEEFVKCTSCNKEYSLCDLTLD